MNQWEMPRLEAVLREQSKQLQEIICLLRLLVESQTPPTYPASADIEVKVS